jgi:hypothetical protein
MKKRSIAALIVAVLCMFETSALAGLGSDKTMYVGGTISSIPEKTEGKSSAKDEKAWVFETKKGKIVVPYDHIDSLEYGQKAGRRIGVAVVINPLFLFSKKRKHYLTLGWTDDDGKQQAGVFELGKDVIRVQLATLEARSGRKIEYQDEEARKSGSGN